MENAFCNVGGVPGAGKVIEAKGEEWWLGCQGSRLASQIAELDKFAYVAYVLNSCACNDLLRA